MSDDIMADVEWLLADTDRTLGSKYHDAGSCWELIDAMRLRFIQMQALMEKLIEQRERAAWEARENAVVMDATGAWVLERNLTFEDWKKTQ